MPAVCIKCALCRCLIPPILASLEASSVCAVEFAEAFPPYSHAHRFFHPLTHNQRCFVKLHSGLRGMLSLLRWWSGAHLVVSVLCLWDLILVSARETELASIHLFLFPLKWTFQNASLTMSCSCVQHIDSVWNVTAAFYSPVAVTSILYV